MTKFSLIPAEEHCASANLEHSPIRHPKQASPKKETSKPVNFLEGNHEPTYLDLLPPELIVLVLSFIKNDFTSVYRCSQTSSKIHETCLKHRELFSALDYHISVQQIGPTCKYSDFPEFSQKLKDPGTFPAIPVTSIPRMDNRSAHQTRNNVWLCFNHIKSATSTAHSTRFRVKPQPNWSSSKLNDNQQSETASGWEIVSFDDSIYKHYRVVVLDDGSWICLGWKAEAEETIRNSGVLLQCFEPDGSLRWQKEAKQVHGIPSISDFDVLYCSRDNVAIYYYDSTYVAILVLRNFQLELGLIDVKTSQIHQVGIAQTVYTDSPDTLEPISQVLTLGKIANNKLGAVVNSIHLNTEHTVYIEFPVDLQKAKPKEGEEEPTEFSVPCREILNDDFTNYVMEHGLTRNGGTLLTLNQSNEISKLPLVIVHNHENQPKLTRFQFHGICRSEEEPQEIIVCFKNATSHAPSASSLENSSSGVSASSLKESPYGLWLVHFDKEGNVKRRMFIDQFKEDFWLFKCTGDEYQFWKKTKPPILILDFQLERYRAGASHNVNIAIINSKGELRKDRIRHHLIAPGIDGRALVQLDGSVVFAAKDLTGFYLLSIKFDDLKW